VDDPIAEINGCRYLFLSDIQELEFNGLRLIVREGLPGETVETIHVGDSVIPGGTRISVTEDSRTFELLWKRYVAYSVLNKSYAAVDEGEQYEGSRFRAYLKSHFIDYVSRASFATAEYPGPFKHYGVACENHIVHVISTDAPRIRPIHARC
jgi:hypothetical protein